MRSLKILSSPRRGAALTEYIIILAMVLAIAVFLFWNSISDALVGMMEGMGIEPPAIVKLKKKPKPPAEEEPGSTLTGSGGDGGSSGGYSSPVSTTPARMR